MHSHLPLLLLLTFGSAPGSADEPSRPPELQGSWPAHPSGRTVTVETDSPDEALKQIAAAAGWGLALNSGSAGQAKVRFSFKQVPVEEAFAAVLYASSLRANRIGDTVAVTPGPAGVSDPDEGGSDERADATDATRGGRWRHRWRHSNDRVQIGHDIDIPAGESVGNVVAVGGSVHLGAGASAHDVVAIGGKITTEASVQVRGDAVAVGGGEQLGPESLVSGDAVTVGGQVQLAPGATIQGRQVDLGPRHLLDWGAPAALVGGLSALFWVSKLAQFVLFFCLGALLLLAAPTQLGAIESFVARQPLRAGLAGFLMTLAIPFLTALLVVTLVGIPLVAVEFFGIALAALMGFTAISVLIGNRLRVPVRGGGLFGLALGTALVIALTALPWVGTAILITVWFVALGAALVTRFGSAA